MHNFDKTIVLKKKVEILIVESSSGSRRHSSPNPKRIRTGRKQESRFSHIFIFFMQIIRGNNATNFKNLSITELIEKSLFLQNLKTFS